MNGKKHPGKYVLIGIGAAFLALFLVLPLLFILIGAFGDGIKIWWENVSETYTVKALKLTLFTAGVSVAINTVFGVLSAWALTRFRFRGRGFLNTLIDIPLSVSPVIAGLIFLLTFGRASPIYDFLRQHDLKIVFAVPGIVLATVFVTLPYVSREIIPVLNAKGTDEEEAAALMGAGGFRIFRKITLPHIKWALLYGVILCTARALGEFGAVSVISGHLRGKTNTLPLQVEILYNEFKRTPAFAVASILVLLAVLLLIVRGIAEKRGGKSGEA